MPKEHLRQQILKQLQAEVELQTEAALLAREEAISEESRAENKYDTHSQEAAYLAEGQARLAAEAMDSIKVYHSLSLDDLPPGSPVSLGALVEVSAQGQSTWYLLGPRAGGLELNLADGTPVLVITPQSPLGRQLLGKAVGSKVQLADQKSVDCHITQIL
jgi:transcription elongation GreA/GreB family factor|uniref:GreA/GreB family elongation factor n=1 Tax=Cephaloticoccus sp. TaxID=1985742 RepID=UPI00404AC8C2